METTPIFSLKDILRIVFKRGRAILLIFFVTVVTVLSASLFFKKPLYESDAQILLEVDQGFIYNPSLPKQDQLRELKHQDLEREVALSVEMLRNEILAGKVVEKLGLAVIHDDPKNSEHKKSFIQHLRERLGRPSKHSDQEDTVRIAALRLQKHLEVTHIEHSPIIKISFQHEDPKLAADVVNTLISLYLEQHLLIRRRPQLFKFFQEQYAVMKSRLEISDRKMKKFKEKYAISSSLQEEKSRLIKRSGEIQTALEETMSRQVEFAIQIKQLRNKLSTIYNPTLIDELVKELVALQAKEKELIAESGIQNPAVQQLRDKMQKTRDKYTRMINSKRYGNANPIPGQGMLYQELEKELLSKEVELDAIQARISALESQLFDYKHRLKELDTIETEFINIEDQLKADRINYHLYQTKFEEFRIFDALDRQKIASIKVLKPARPPVESLPSKRSLLLLLAIFFGGMGSIGIAFVLEFFSGVINTEQDVDFYLQRPLLASIPDIKSEYTKY